jgi:hypothetical protein
MLLTVGIKMTVGAGYPVTTQSTWNVPSASTLNVGQQLDNREKDY